MIYRSILSRPSLCDMQIRDEGECSYIKIGDDYFILFIFFIIYTINFQTLNFF